MARKTFSVGDNRGSGFGDWVAPRVRSERAVVRGIKADSRQASVRGGGRKSSNNARKSTKAGNYGSFGRQ